MSGLYFTTKHIAKWQLKDYPHIVISEDKLLYNFKTNRTLKQVLKGSTIGYVIEKKFLSLKQINEQCIKLKINKPMFDPIFT